MGWFHERIVRFILIPGLRRSPPLAPAQSHRSLGALNEAAINRRPVQFLFLLDSNLPTNSSKVVRVESATAARRPLKYSINLVITCRGPTLNELIPGGGAARFQCKRAYAQSLLRIVNRCWVISGILGSPASGSPRGGANWAVLIFLPPFDDRWRIWNPTKALPLR